MSTKFRNSTWVRNQTRQPFQQAHLGTFWTPESASKQAPKWRGAHRKWRGTYRKKAQFYLRFVKFRFATSPSGPAHLHFSFLTPKAALKVFSLQIGFYPSGKGRQTVTPMPNVMFAALHLQLMVGSPSPFCNDSSNSQTLGHSIYSSHILYIVCKLFSKGWLACNFQETVGKKLCFFTVYF